MSAHNPTAPRDELLAALLPVARRAGDAILEVYSTEFEVRSKADASPVTEADESAEDIILSALAVLTPEIPVVSEERAARLAPPGPVKRFWLVDPLDGTKEFVNRNGEFTVNIALIESGRPVLGVVLAPALEQLYAGTGTVAFFSDGREQWELVCRVVPADGATVVSSRSHGDESLLRDFLVGQPVAASTTAGSSLKFCLVAAGKADIYPRLGTTMEWDTAAGHAMLNAAGGHVTTLDGVELGYGKPGFRNPHFVAQGRLQTACVRIGSSNTLANEAPLMHQGHG